MCVSAGGAIEVSPARKGWELNTTRSQRAVGAALFWVARLIGLLCGISYASGGTYRLAKNFVSPYSLVRSSSAILLA